MLIIFDHLLIVILFWQRLFLYFKKLSEFSATNMMTAYNISCTIANDLLRANPPNADEYNLVADIVAFVIENVQEILGVLIIYF